MTETTNDQLKPCPFCGTPAKWFKTGRDIGIECGEESDCPGNAQTDTYAPEHREACVRTWNRRAATAPAQPVDERKAFALPPLPHTTYNGYSDGSEPLYTAEQMKDYARAALASNEAAPQEKPANQMLTVEQMESLIAEQGKRIFELEEAARTKAAHEAMADEYQELIRFMDAGTGNYWDFRVMLAERARKERAA
jgi:hypothetical protein